ncbi:UPF0262 family protein [Shinella sumterensis]|jgi:uncharacterized protein (UPF0262 family)|uniref:UPF0262 family protein n=1 Tax=Shinella sumterensis TaxID=1967501 RepID=UPI00351337E2
MSLARATRCHCVEAIDLAHRAIDKQGAEFVMERMAVKYQIDSDRARPSIRLVFVPMVGI